MVFATTVNYVTDFKCPRSLSQHKAKIHNNQNKTNLYAPTFSQMQFFKRHKSRAHHYVNQGRRTDSTTEEPHFPTKRITNNSFQYMFGLNANDSGKGLDVVTKFKDATTRNEFHEPKQAYRKISPDPLNLYIDSLTPALLGVDALPTARPPSCKECHLVCASLEHLCIHSATVHKLPKVVLTRLGIEESNQQPYVSISNSKSIHKQCEIVKSENSSQEHQISGLCDVRPQLTPNNPNEHQQKKFAFEKFRQQYNMDPLESEVENIWSKSATSARPTKDPISEDESMDIIILNTFTVAPELIRLDEVEDEQNVRTSNNISKQPRNENFNDSVIPKILKPSRQKSDYYQCKFCSERFSMLRYLRKHFTTPDKELPNHCQEYYTASIKNGHASQLDKFCTKGVDTLETEQIPNDEEGDDNAVQILSVFPKFKASLSELFVETAGKTNTALEENLLREISLDDQRVEQQHNSVIDKLGVPNHNSDQHSLTDSGVPTGYNDNDQERMSIATKCNICNCEFSSQKLLQNHTAAIHNILKSTQLIIGLNESKGFPSSQEQQQKLKNEQHSSKNRHICSLCKQEFCRPRYLTRHKLSAHGLNPLDCDLCSKRFSSVEYVSKHKLAVHEGIRYKCDLCQKEYTSIYKVKTHKRIAHEGFRHKCDLCQKMFEKADSLKEHKRVVHHGLWYECDFCPKEFGRSASLWRHTLAVHNIQKDSQDLVGLNESNGSPSLEQQQQLLQKQKRGLKPFKCILCSRRFPSMLEVDIHKILVHERDRYKCDLCQKDFVQMRSLQEHKLVIHKGYRQKCAFCQKEFFSPSSLSRHKFKVHRPC